MIQKPTKKASYYEHRKMDGFVYQCKKQKTKVSNEVPAPEPSSNKWFQVTNRQLLIGKWKEHNEEPKKTYMNIQAIL